MDTARAQILAATRDEIAATTRESWTRRRGTVPDHIRRMLEEDGRRPRSRPRPLVALAGVAWPRRGRRARLATWARAAALTAARHRLRWRSPGADKREGRHGTGSRHPARTRKMQIIRPLVALAAVLVATTALAVPVASAARPGPARRRSGSPASRGRGPSPLARIVSPRAGARCPASCGRGCGSAGAPRSAGSSCGSTAGWSPPGRRASGFVPRWTTTSVANGLHRIDLVTIGTGGRRRHVRRVTVRNGTAKSRRARTRPARRARPVRPVRPAPALAPVAPPAAPPAASPFRSPRRRCRRRGTSTSRA